jgi:hypothetical protein
MTYELAKELKDAGWPQLGDGNVIVLDWPLPQSDQTVTVIPWPLYVHNPMPNHEVVYAPTLSELIDACGEDFEAVRKVTLEFDHTHYWLAETDNKRWIACKGLSPTEAVARLWLALNTKS